MHGIFFDEVVSDWSSDAVNFMKTINQAVKDATGLLGDRTVSLSLGELAKGADCNTQTVHNPGTIPDTRFEDSNTDITVVFESSFNDFDSKQDVLSALPDARDRYAYMVHSSSLGKSSLQNYVNELSQHADWLFITNLEKNYYEKFGSDWASFVAAIPA